MDTPLKSDTPADPDVQAAPVNSRKTARVGLFALSVGILATALIAVAIVAALSLVPASSSEKKIVAKRGTAQLSCAQNKANSEYDYIVVGSGSGGSTISTRLAMNGYKVLLIEAGPDYNDGYVNTPAFWALTQTIKNITAYWNTYLFDQKNGETIQYPRGMALGGSTVNNVLVGMTASPLDWDYIAAVTNDSDWSSANMIGKYQRLVENCKYCSGPGSNARQQGFYNITLPSKRLVTSTLNQTNPVYANFLNHINDTFVYNPDVNADDSYDSWFYLPVSADQDTGIRCSGYKRIKNVQARVPDNLIVWTNTFVTKLLIDSQTKDACGVEYVKGEFLYKANAYAKPNGSPANMEKFQAYAKREVIVAGGQWLTPQLLQLSGIGPPELLQKYGIEVIQPLPGVGQNLQDRNEMSYIVKLKNNSNILGANIGRCQLSPTPQDPCYVDYQRNPRSSLYSTNLVLAAALHSEDPVIPRLADSAYLFAPLYFTGFRKNWVPDAIAHGVGTHCTVNINTARMLNKRGTVQIRSSNPFDTPLIQTRHLTGPTKRTETRIIIQHLRFLRKFLTTGDFADKHVEAEVLPGPKVKSDKQMIKFIRRYIWGHHSSCTCKMGDTEADPMAVLNSKGQVKGIKNLRVCDISMFPQIIAYYPVVPMMTAAEKIAHDTMQAASSQG